MVNFEPYTGRILHGIIETAHVRSGDPTIKAVDLAAVQVVSLDIRHFGTMPEMDRAMFLMARPAGEIVGRVFKRVDRRRPGAAPTPEMESHCQLLMASSGLCFACRLTMPTCTTTR